MALDGIIANVTADQETMDALFYEATGYKWWGLASHVTFLVLFEIGRRYKQPFVIVVSIPALLFSLVYHTCISWDMCMGLSKETTRRNDHLSAQLFILLVFYVISIIHDVDAKPGTLAAVLDVEARARMRRDDTLDVAAADPDDGDLGASLNPPLYQLYWREFWLIFAMICTAVVTYTWPVADSIFPFYIVTVLGLTGWLLYVIVRVERPLQSTDTAFMLGPTQLHWPMFAAFILLAAVSVVFFLIPETMAKTIDGVLTTITTSFYHSWWHFFSPLAISAIILAKELRPDDPLYVIDAIKRRAPPSASNSYSVKS